MRNDAGIAIRELPLVGQLHALASRRADKAVTVLQGCDFDAPEEIARQKRRARHHRLEAIATSVDALTLEEASSPTGYCYTAV